MTGKRRAAVFRPEFLRDLRYWVEADRKVALRALHLIEENLREPTAGAGKPDVTPHFIEPGRAIQDTFVESFNGGMRDEPLNEEIFVDLHDARGEDGRLDLESRDVSIAVGRDLGFAPPLVVELALVGYNVNGRNLPSATLPSPAVGRFRSGRFGRSVRTRW